MPKGSSKSMKKPSAESFEILSVEEEKGKVVLVFSRFSLVLSSYLYASSYYYPGKVLSQEEVERLKEKIAEEKGRIKIERMLSRGRKTRNQCRESLFKMKGLNRSQIEEILSFFQKQGLLDDSLYALDYAKERMEKGYGKKNILAQLSKKGIEKEVLEGDDFKKVFEEEDIPEGLLKSLYKKSSNLTTEISKQKMLQFLIHRGFPYSLSKKKVDHFYGNLPSSEKEKALEKRRELLGEKGKKCYNQLLRTKADLPALKKKFFQKLSKDGFRFEEIQSAWNENHEGDDHD